MQIKKNVQQALDRYASLFSSEELQRLQSMLEKTLPLSMRMNTLRYPAQEQAEKLHERYGWSLRQVPFCASGFWLENKEGSASTTIEHRLADFYIQDAASMLPAELLDFQKHSHPLILDMAASPGGKTIHLADLSQDDGFIVANDASRNRIPALQIVLQNWGVIKQAVTCLNGAAFGKLYPNTFDCVLLDAPCSMENLFHSASHPMRSISEGERERLAKRQQYLLSSAIQTCKPGGQIVYATCTLAPEEDEAVLAEVLKEWDGFMQIDDVRHAIPVAAPGIMAFEGKTFPKEVQRALRLWPHNMGTSGFFCARLQKMRESPEGKKDTGQSTHLAQKNIYKPLSQKAKQELYAFYLDHFGFDLQEYGTQKDLEICARGQDIQILPKEIFTDFRELPFLLAGLPATKRIKDSFQPAHAFAMRFAEKFTKGFLDLPSEHYEAWIRGSDIVGYQPSEAKIGEFVLVKDPTGRNLGLGKVLDKRLKNLLPSRMF